MFDPDFDESAGYDLIDLYYYPWFLLHMDPTGKDDGQLIDEAIDVAQSHFYDKRQNEFAKTRLFTPKDRIEFPNRHVASRDNDLSGHQKMAATKAAAANFSRLIHESWSQNFHPQDRQRYQEFTSRKSPPDASTLRSHAAIQKAYEKYSTWLFNKVCQTPEKKTEYQHQLPARLSGIHASKIGAFSLDHSVPMESWMTFDLTFGRQPNAIFCQTVLIPTKVRWEIEVPDYD